MRAARLTDCFDEPAAMPHPVGRCTVNTHPLPAEALHMSGSVHDDPRTSIARLGMVVYRVSVVGLLAVIALPHLRQVAGRAPAAAEVQSGFTLGPSRSQPGRATPQPPLNTNPPSTLLTTYGIPTYSDAFPDQRDMLPRDLNGVPVVYVVNLPFLDGGRRGLVPADLRGVDWGTAQQFKP